MPARTYMVVAARRDHGFRVPRPDLTEKIGVPNACSSCHADRSAAWAARTIVGWRNSGVAPRPHYGETLHAGRRGLPGAARALAELAADSEASGIVRQRRLSEALDALGRAATLALEQPRYAYVHGVALHSLDRADRALSVLGEAHRRHPGDQEILLALAHSTPKTRTPARSHASSRPRASTTDRVEPATDDGAPLHREEREVRR